MKSFLLAIILISISKVLAREGRLVGGRIIGGFAIDIEKIPFQVSLRLYGFLICGGSIISSKYVLTAAHCTNDFPKNDLSIFSIRAGSTRSDQGGSIHNITNIFEHPKFDPNLLDYDACIIKVFNQIHFDKFRQPIQLPYFGEPTPEGSLVSTSGWGLTMNSNESNLSLRNVELRISNRTLCNEAYIRDGGISNRMICAYAEGKDSCSGGNFFFLLKIV